MPLFKKEEESKVTTFQYIFALGLFLLTFMGWLFWDTTSTAVILTGAAAITVIIKRYQKN
jgi:hypothetical protein